MQRIRLKCIPALAATLFAASLALITTPVNAVTGSAATDTTYAFTAHLDIGEGDATRACSGVLVDAWWLLTAASCFADDPAVSLAVPAGAPALKTTATIGRTDLTTTVGQVRNVAELVPSPDPAQDVVLARLDNPVLDITPVAVSSSAPTAGEELTVAGYGRTRDEWAPLLLHTGTFTLDSVSAGEVGITGKDGVAVCKGDTGGPLLRNANGSLQLVGINSRSWQGGCFGTDATETRTSAVDTRADGLRSWISSRIPIHAGEFYAARGYARTSTGTTAQGMSIGAHTTATVKVTGVGGVPESGVASVALNLTTRAATGVATDQGSLIVYPSDGSRPAVTSARYRGDVRSSDLIQVKVGADGNVNIENNGPVAVTVDAAVHGYTMQLTSKASAPGSTYVGLTPSRIVGQGSTAVTIAAGATFKFSPLGQGGVPTSGVSQVEFTLTGSVAADTPLTVFASDEAQPSDPDVVVAGSDPKDNLVLAKVGQDGQVNIRNGGSATVRIWVDLAGYYVSPQAAEPGSLMVPVQPTRVVNDVPVGADNASNSSDELTVAPLGTAGVPTTGVTSVGMVVTVKSSGSGWVQVYPSFAALPGTRETGYSANILNSGFIDAKLGPNGKVTIKNSGTTTVNVSVDVYSYFKPEPTPFA